MTAQIRPNRMEVSDRFPMLGFAVRTDAPNVEAEVVLASDIALFGGANRNRRTAANFYSSREHGTLTVPRGEGVFVVPPDVLARFIGSDKIYFGLATGHSGNGGLSVDALPRDGSPYVSLRGFTGRTLRRSFGGTGSNSSPRLEWSGDAPKPGSEGANGSAAAPAAPQPAGNYDDGFGPMPTIPARESSYQGGSTLAASPRPADAQVLMPAAGLVWDAEDMKRAEKLARHHQDIFQWVVPNSIVAKIKARGFELQRIEDAAGDLNLDHYQVRIDRFPENIDAAHLLEYFIRHINTFVDTDNTSFDPYDSNDATTLALPNPVGTVLKLDIAGPDNAAVVISAKAPQYYTVSTIRTPNTGDHPVSGHRQFGYFVEDGITTFYTRGADRSTAPIPGTEWLIWRGAEALWQSFQERMVAFFAANGGSATALKPFSERFNASAMRIAWGHFDTAQSLGVDDAPPAMPGYVPPPLPNDARARANRIGGEFGPRIGEALDHGLDAATLKPLLDTLDPQPAAKPLGYAGAMAAPTWSINWDDIDPVPQPTPKSCWATALSMLVGWRDSKSIMPSWIAQQCGRSIDDGLPWANRAAAAAALGLGTVAPACYTPEGFRGLIENHGPLYVGKIMSDTINSGHAVLVVGMYSDGQDHFLRVVDPWDRAAGTPGAPDPYSRSHSTGSSYIMRYDDFQNQYEMAAAGNPAYVQIIYAGVPAGRTINTGTSAPRGFAMAAVQAVARPMGGSPWSINWDNIELLAQPTPNGCWATTLAMLMGWRDQKCYAPDTIAQKCGHDINFVLPWADRASAAASLGMHTLQPQCYDADMFANLIRRHGPLYVGKATSAGAMDTTHAVLVVGMYCDGTDYFVRIHDSEDRAVGTPGVPGGYLGTHNRGTRYIMRYDVFANEYEMGIRGNPAYAQIIHAGIPVGRTINTASPPAGFAMTVDNEPRRLMPPPPPQTRALEAVAIAGIAIDVISNSSGDIKTNLANWAGVKHPGDVAPKKPAAFQEDSVTLRDWPLVGGTFGIDDIYCWLKIRWQYNGTSLGHIYIEDIGHDDAAGWGLTVNTTIEDDSRLYARSSQARMAGPAQVPALHVNITYTFDEVMADDQVANTRVTLYADGTYDVNSHWVQHSRPGGGTPTVVTRPFQLA